MFPTEEKNKRESDNGWTRVTGNLRSGADVSEFLVKRKMSFSGRTVAGLTIRTRFLSIRTIRSALGLPPKAKKTAGQYTA